MKLPNQYKTLRIVIAFAALFLLLVLAWFFYTQSNSNSTLYRWVQESEDAEWDNRSDACSIAFKGKLWLFGGNRTDPDPPDNRLDIVGFLNQRIYDIWFTDDGVEWAQSSRELPEGFGCQILKYDDKLWSFGNGVWTSEDGENWRNITDSLPIDSYSVTVFQDKFWLLGGVDADIFKNEIWSSDDGSAWERVAEQAPWPARIAHAYSTTEFDGKLWVIGGMIDDPEDAGRIISTNDAWYTTDGKNWTEVESNESWPGASSHRVFTYDRYMWIFGGRRNDPGGRMVNELWRSLDGINWELMEVKNDDWYPRYDYAFAVYDDHIWVIGGHEHRSEEPKLGDAWQAELPI